jgi:5-formyltetrahydrofolate cyclo-ligase
MMDNQSSKSRLRSLLRQRRQAIPTSAQRAAAHALTHSVFQLPDWHNARRIAVYMAADGEIDPLPLASAARSAGKQLFLPIINPDLHLHFALWEDETVLEANRYNIPEPPGSAALCLAPDLDIVFLPLVGWDLRGGRLGMGGGFYDRTLAAVEGPVLVGLGYDAQQVAELPRDCWDVELHYVATEVALYRNVAR